MLKNQLYRCAKPSHVFTNEQAGVRNRTVLKTRKRGNQLLIYTDGESGFQNIKETLPGAPILYKPFRLDTFLDTLEGLQRAQVQSG